MKAHLMYRDRDFDLQREPAAARSGVDAGPGAKHAVRRDGRRGQVPARSGAEGGLDEP